MMVEKVTLGVFFGIYSRGSTPGFRGCIPRVMLTGTFPQAGFSTPTGDSAAFPTVGGFTGSWSRPEIL